MKLNASTLVDDLTSLERRLLFSDSGYYFPIAIAFSPVGTNTYVLLRMCPSLQNGFLILSNDAEAIVSPSLIIAPDKETLIFTPNRAGPASTQGRRLLGLCCREIYCTTGKNVSYILYILRRKGRGLFGPDIPGSVRS
jgi:hypothetical protein